ncbi:3'-N-debenzoyl-2'-deoxytaxol N-benzoyltransferase, putative [Ricinus communis]|uniref:3'-N-debenzoyl-2'-deoxytaxol N-benzoyltransferase, putative n=1 Tax=Ricinus communis TaxID=3988 RepID=B9RMN8_RICCO|nr:3'-N-debenzoyl-2'-deoxytaxol N-benzoyltransferase, putative [Ricinus communis]|eukprot:XP_025012399.1 BAHD acyltransferase At5g47980-like [Ricinus communis]
MAMAAKVKIIQRETIKPSSPTPPELKIHKLSLLDQLIPTNYIPVVLFYPANDGDNLDHHANSTERSLKLKTSLSETLTHYYPFAGRIKDSTSVECDDQGADFIQARINCLLSDVLKSPDAVVLRQFLPAAITSTEAATGNLLLVQATFFHCGGLAVGVCISHKISDATTLKAFIKCWVATATSSSTESATPLFMGASIFPPVDISIPTSVVELMKKQCITKRFVFTGSKIAALKAKVASTTMRNPTRVETVSGLLWKTAMAATRSKLGYSRPSVWSMPVNMRTRFLPPLPESYAGNCLLHINPKIADESELKELVGRIRKEIEGFRENYVKKLRGERAVLATFGFFQEYGNLAMNNDIDLYTCTSWCKLELYDADFGWGRPLWVGIDSIPLSNVVCLMDTRDGDGIEAWLTLGEENMALFESNQELLQFAAVNPSVPFCNV